MIELKSRHLFTLTIELHSVEELGHTPAGNRRVFPVSGGNFNGERIRGIVLPVAGSDLLLSRADGTSQQDVRMILRTDDGALILMTYRGVRHASPEDDRIACGEPVAASAKGREENAILYPAESFDGPDVQSQRREPALVR